MPLPPAATTVPVHGQIVHPATGVAATGSVTFSIPAALRDNPDRVILGMADITVQLDATGAFLVNLIATDSANLTPTGWAYTVRVSTNVWVETFLLQVPSATPGTLELASVAPAINPPPAQTYAAVNHTHAYLTQVQGDARYLTPSQGDARYLTQATGDARYLTPVNSPVWGQPTVITHFQSGHGWTGTNFGPVNLNDTSDGVQGSQVVTVTTVGNAAVYATLDRTGLPAANTSGRMIRIWVKLDNPNTINNINIRAAPAGGIAGNSYFSWDVVLAPYYAGQYLTPAGQWTCLGLSFADNFTVGTPARTAITEWRVVVNDTGVASTVHFGGIEVYNATPPKYANGVVTLCFDDSYVGHYNIARTVLGQYGYQATLMPIVDVVGTSGYMTVAQMQTLQNLMGWEMGLHAYTLANHGNFGSLTTAQIQADVTSSMTWMASNGFRRGGSYAYPLGIFSSGQDAAVAPYVALARTIQSTLANETLPTAHPLRLRASSGVGGVGGLSVSSSITNTGGILDQCKAQQSWCILTMHDVLPGASTGINQISQADLTTLVSGIQSRGIAVATMSEVIRSGAFGI